MAFDFTEAERRLRLGNKHIKRFDWILDTLDLYDGQVQRYNPLRLAFWDLTKEDTEATDWIDPAE